MATKEVGAITAMRKKTKKKLKSAIFRRRKGALFEKNGTNLYKTGRGKIGFCYAKHMNEEIRQNPPDDVATSKKEPTATNRRYSTHFCVTQVQKQATKNSK
jgi:hypothetical protein